jgi:hypothetical protein
LFTAVVAMVPSALVADDIGRAWPRSPEVVVTAEPTLDTSLPITWTAGASVLPPPPPVGVPGDEPPLGVVGAVGAGAEVAAPTPAVP